MYSTGIARGGFSSASACDIVPATGAIAAIRSDSDTASRFDMYAPFERPVA